MHNVQELDALDLATLKLWADPGVDQAMRMDPHLFAVLNQRLPKIASTSAGSTGGAGGGASSAGNVTGAGGPSTGKALKVFRKPFPKDQRLAVAGPYEDFDAGRAAITTERERTRVGRASGDSAIVDFAGSTRPWRAVASHKRGGGLHATANFVCTEPGCQYTIRSLRPPVLIV